MPAKAIHCNTCGSNLHYTTFCYQSRKKAIKKQGKQALNWRSERQAYIETTKPDSGIWQCHYCGVDLVESKDDQLFNPSAMLLTIDHIKPRSSNPHLRFDMDNLVPCCSIDNVMKGSQSYRRFVERHYPHLLTINPD